MNSLKNILCILTVVTVLVLSSCGGDEKTEVKGCTDSRAENYNAKATSNDNSCVFPNEKFVGKYKGTLNCPGLFSAANSDDVEFEFAPPANANDVDKITLSATVGGIPLSLEGNVNGNEITFVDKKVDNVPFQGLTVSITFSGKATLNGNDLTAELSVSAGIASDKCTFKGKKS